jgi:hypothetical protein
MQINYQTVTIDALPGNDKLTVDDYFVVAQNHHKTTDTFINGDFVGKKITLSDIMNFVRNNVPYIYNTAYKYNPSTLSTEVFENIIGFKFIHNYISVAKDLSTSLLEVGLQLPQDIAPSSNVIFNKVNSNSISATTLTATNLNISSTINGVITSALKFQTAMAITLTGSAIGSCLFDGTAGVNLDVSIKDNTHRHNNTTLDDISWSKVTDKPSPHVDINLTGPITATSFFNLVSLGNDSVSLATTITPGAVDLITHTTGNYLNHITASGNGLSIAELPNHNNVQDVHINAISSNTPNSIVYRDALGNFITNSIACSTLYGDVYGNIVGNVTGNINGNVTGDVTGDVTGNINGSLTGNVVGNVTGNVTGNINGNSTGLHTGNVIGDITGNVTGNLIGNVIGNLTGNIIGNSSSSDKLSSGKTISGTGDVTFTTPTFDGTTNISTVMTLSNSGVAAGTYNNDSQSVRPFTVDSKGRITNIGAAVPISYIWNLISGTPTTSSGYGITDVYTKSYIDTLALGLKPKIEVKVATTANITLSGTQTIDSIPVSAGDRVLVMSQSTSAQNGIYTVNSDDWTRTTDANSAQLLNGALVSVASGTLNANKKFFQVSNVSTLDTDPVLFGVFASSGAYSPIITGAASTIVSTNLPGSKVVVTDASGKLAISSTTLTELGYLTGVTSSVQSQLSNKADSSALSLHSTSITGIHGINGNIVGTTDNQTITNKTFILSNNNLSGTLAQFNTALSDDNFCSLSGIETLQNKTIQSPIVYSPNITGGIYKNGIYTNATIYAPVITGGTLSNTALNNASLMSPNITGGNTRSQVINIPVIYSPTVTGGSFSNINITNGSFTGCTLLSPSITGGTYKNSIFNTSTFNNSELTGCVLHSPTMYTPNIGIASGNSFNGFVGLSDLKPLMDSVSDAGVSNYGSRCDHRHPTDTSRSPFNGPGETEIFTIGSLHSNANGYITTISDTSFMIESKTINKSSSLRYRIGETQTLSDWKTGSFYTNGKFNYSIINNSNGYVAFSCLNDTGKMIFGNAIDNLSNSIAQFNGNIDVNGVRFENYLSSFITNRTLQNGRNELIIFNTYDKLDKIGQVTLRAPILKFQTFNSVNVDDETNLSGENDRIIINQVGTIFVNQQPEDDTITSDIVKINGSIKASGHTQSIKSINDDVYQISEEDYTILASSPATGGQLLILPSVTNNKGRILNIKKISDIYISDYIPFLQSNKLLIKPLEQNTKIDSKNILVLSSKFESVTLQSDGTTWYII